MSDLAFVREEHDLGHSIAALTVSHGASYLAIQTVITSAAMAVSFAILARIITPEEMGILAVLLLVNSFCLAVDGSALQQAATKFIGELSPGQREVVSGIFYENFRISLLVSIPLAVVIFLAAPALALGLLRNVGYAYLFKILAVDIPVFSGVLPVAIGTLFGLKRFKATATIGVAGALLRQCLIILLIVFMKDFAGLVIAWVLSDVAIVSAYTIYIFGLVGRPKRGFSIRRLFSFSWPLTFGNIITFAYGWFDRALLIAFVPIATLGIYSAALTAFTVLVGISLAMMNALLPVYSGISGVNRLESCKRATALASRYVSFALVPLAFGLFATARPALSLFVGQAYIDGTDPLMILSSVFALTAFGVALGPMMLALSETRLVSGITIASIGVGFGSAFLFLRYWGMLGAPVARGLATITTTALTAVALHRKQVLGLDVNAIWKSLVAGALMAGSLLLMQMTVYNRFILPVYILVGCVVYLAALRLLKAVRKEDVNLVRHYLGPRLVFASRILNVILVCD